MRLAPLSLTGLTDSKQKLYQMKLSFEDGQLRGALSLAAAPLMPRAATRAWRRAASLAANGSAAKHLLQSSVRRRAAGGGRRRAAQERNRDEISEAELTDAARDLERVFAKSPS